MATISSWAGDFALDQLADGEELSLNLLHMDKETALSRLDDIYTEGFERCQSTFDCKGMYRSLSVVGKSDDAIELEDGVVFKSAQAARLLCHAEEVVLYAATVHGYEEMLDASGGDALEEMLCNAWGAGYSMSCNGLVKGMIVQAAQEQDLFVGRGWSPGENDLDIGLQKTLLDAMDIAQIGVSAKGTMVRPIMTVCGFMGVSSDPVIKQDGADLPESTMN
ncbi:MAG: hypothetical protein IJ131_09560 [Eggerthellaceae bacterium]|nr:hypothetical protein [Eggerthellaceae bacterium]